MEEDMRNALIRMENDKSNKNDKNRGTKDI